MYVFLSPFQHFQLLMQTFVLSRFEPSLVFLSQISAQAIVRPELDTLHIWRCILKPHAFLLCLSMLRVQSQGSAYTHLRTLNIVNGGRASVHVCNELRGSCEARDNDKARCFLCAIKAEHASQLPSPINMTLAQSCSTSMDCRTSAVQPVSMLVDPQLGLNRHEPPCFTSTTFFELA